MMMMMIEHSCESRVWFIGDPHLGKRFENGVPLNRRGEREARQMKKFKAELDTDCDINIMVGDLFDHPQVSLQAIVDTADAYELAALRRPQTFFIIMAGNHDRSRQLNTVGAWEIFKRLIGKGWNNLHVVDTPEVVQIGEESEIAIFPWQWGITAAGQVENCLGGKHVELAVGHWDLETFGGSGDHLAPTKALKKAFGDSVRLVTGHWHLEGSYKVDGVDIDCTGSLEPYTHAEDPGGTLYVTLTLDELHARPASDFKDKAVRVLLREGEELPHELDCLQLSAKRRTEINDEPSVAEKLGTFDWQVILDEHLKDVKPYVREFIDDRLQH